MAKKFSKFSVILTGEGRQIIKKNRDKVLKIELPALREKIASKTDPSLIVLLEHEKKELLRYVLRQNQLLNYSHTIMPLPMKYFEIHEPYYALLKAQTQEEAIETYTEFVADDDGTLKDEIKEVDRDYALVKFAMGDVEGGEKMSPREIVETFNLEMNEVLCIDSSVL